MNLAGLDKIKNAIWNNDQFNEYFQNRYEIKNECELLELIDTLEDRPAEVKHLIQVLKGIELKDG